MKKRAFTIFELIVYMAIFSLFSGLSFGYLSKIYKKVFFQIKEDQTFIRNNILLDTLKRDLFVAKKDLAYWDEKMFTFRTKNIFNKTTDISWQFRKDGVFRLIGLYDFNKKIWLKKNVARFDFNQQAFSYSIIKNNNKVELINILLNEKQNFFVKLKNECFLL
jgi:type II secretory pathway pseudopilin PulG